MSQPIERLLYVSPTSVFDQSNGASISIRTLLKGLGEKGITVRALNATAFDHPDGAKLLNSMIQQPLKDERGFLVKHGDNYVTTLRTAHPDRRRMTTREEHFFFATFCRALEDLKPDAILTWGAGVLDLLIMAEARRRAIPVIFYLVSNNYNDPFWKRDVSHFITDSEATAKYYKTSQGIDVVSVGKFFDREDFVTTDRDPIYITFVNPQENKGAPLFAQLALMAKDQLPSARFLVVESRGKWPAALSAMDLDPKMFTNVDMAPIQDSMRAVYGVTRTLLVPSYKMDSGPRVIGEALINGIPVLGSNHGGIPENIGRGGRTFDIPEEYRESRRGLPPQSIVQPWLDEIRRHYSDTAYYAQLSEEARAESQKFDLDKSLQRFLGIFQ